MSIWTLSFFSSRITPSVSSCEASRERDDDALDVVLAARARRGRVGRRARRGRRGRRAAPWARASTKPTTPMPYSRCWISLRATSWPTSPAPTTIAFCTYAGLRGDAARAHGAAGGHEDDRERPERDELRHVRGCGDPDAHDDDEAEPGADGREVEDTDQVVERRVVGALVVVVVELVELRERRPSPGSSRRSSRYCSVDEQPAAASRCARRAARAARNASASPTASAIEQAPPDELAAPRCRRSSGHASRDRLGALQRSRLLAAPSRSSSNALLLPMPFAAVLERRPRSSVEAARSPFVGQTERLFRGGREPSRMGSFDAVAPDGIVGAWRAPRLAPPCTCPFVDLAPSHAPVC